jgi:hypothetical protein
MRRVRCPSCPSEGGAGAVNPGGNAAERSGATAGWKPSGGNPVSDTHEVPFYDRDGEHWMTVEIEVDDAG